MLKEIANNKIIRLIIIVLLVPILFVGFTYLLEIIFYLGRIIGTYLKCL